MTPEELRVIAEAELAATYLENAHKFLPRPDNPAEFDQQTGYYRSAAKVSICLGGNGSGKTATSANKCAQFVLRQQRPPRKDTPFIIASDTYRQVGAICWKEKLSTIIPNDQVDWERCEWYSRKQNLPYIINLKPWKDTDANWSLEFRSLDQGRQHFQGRSFGGFWFSEQFDFSIFEEVVRGCRDCWFDGGHFAEFTPIDPDLSIAIEERMDSQPMGWAFFRLNTLKNTAISEDWKQSFFETVSPELLETRKTGAMPTFLGAIYQNFNPAVHVLDDEQWAKVFGKPLPDRYCDFDEFRKAMPPGFFYRRSFDWGESIEHPFVTIWGAKDGAGNWAIYDEFVEDTGTMLYCDRREEIKNRWPWPENNPYYGLSYGDPSRPLLIQEFTADGIPTVGASNSVENGIEYVRNLLKINKLTRRPGLYIHKRNCPRLIKELRKYRWVRGVTEGKNPHVARAVPLKWQDDACFPAGQLVDTPGGPVPIERVKTGDRIYGQSGVARADVGAVKVCESATIELTFSDGRRIMCTPEHLLMSAAGKWIEARQSLGMEVVSLCGCGPRSTGTARRSSAANMADSCGDAICSRIPQTTISRETQGKKARNSGQSNCTIRSIRTTTGRYLREWWCTTRTETRRTIHQRISHCLRRRPTARSIATIWKRPDLLRQAGIGRKLAGNGTASTEGKCFRTARFARSPASTAAGNLKRKTCGKKPAFVRASVGIMPEWQAGSMMSIGPARSAERLSEKTDTRLVCAVPVSAGGCYVVQIKRHKKPQAVYCLASSDGTFFVNGVLVKNCDALRYLTYSDRVHSTDAPAESLFVSGEHDRHGVLGANKRRG